MRYGLSCLCSYVAPAINETLAQFYLSTNESSYGVFYCYVFVLSVNCLQYCIYIPVIVLQATCFCGHNNMTTDEM